MKIRWTRVRAGEAPFHGVQSPQPGWVGRAEDKSLYFVWVQSRPRHEGPFYAGARVRPDGHVECYTRLGDPDPRPPGVTGAWLCDEGPISEAKTACVEDAEWRTCRHCSKTGLDLFKYGPRSYAHADCLLMAKGEAGFDLLAQHGELRSFPVSVAEEHGFLAALGRRLGFSVPLSDVLCQSLGPCPDCAQGTAESCLRCDGTATICDVCGEAPAACGCPITEPEHGPRTRVLSDQRQDHDSRRLRPYGEQHGSPRGGLGRLVYQAGGSYHPTATEKARVRRQPKKRARREGKKETKS